MKATHRMTATVLLLVATHAAASTWTSKTGTTMDAEFVKEIMAIAREEGFGEVYFYLHDEAGAEARRQEIPVCKMVHDNDAKTFVADNSHTALNVLREHLDLPNLSPQTLGTGVIDYYHSLGRKCYTYMRPNVEGSPEMFRRNYGFGLWQMGYDGAMPWTWCYWGLWRSSKGFPWISDPHRYIKWAPQRIWRMMAWRTADGFMETIEGDGFRAAVNDIRYLTALLAATEAAKSAGYTKEAREAEAFVEELRNTLPWDFQGVRWEIAERTTRLHKLLR